MESNLLLLKVKGQLAHLQNSPLFSEEAAQSSQDCLCVTKMFGAEGSDALLRQLLSSLSFFLSRGNSKDERHVGALLQGSERPNAINLQQILVEDDQFGLVSPDQGRDGRAFKSHENAVAFLLQDIAETPGEFQIGRASCRERV